MNTFEAISKRFSCRDYTLRSIEKRLIEQILEAGMNAPSGKNLQPWKFIVIQKDKRLLQKISALSIYDAFVKCADALICVFYDLDGGYNYTKDVQGVGACIQNMLLSCTELDIGACWIGEILNKDTQVSQLLNTSNKYKLMAVLALGYPGSVYKRVQKKNLKECLMGYL